MHDDAETREKLVYMEEGGGGVVNGLRRIAAGVCVQTLMCKYGGTTM